MPRRPPPPPPQHFLRREGGKESRRRRVAASAPGKGSPSSRLPPRRCFTRPPLTVQPRALSRGRGGPPSPHVKRTRPVPAPPRAGPALILLRPPPPPPAPFSLTVTHVTRAGRACARAGSPAPPLLLFHRRSRRVCVCGAVRLRCTGAVRGGLTGAAPGRASI